MLVDDGDQIILHIPWQNSNRGSVGQIERWFSSGARFSDDPDRKKYSYAPPAEMLFHDAQGSVLLIGCQPAGYKANVMRGLGKGRVSVDAAILGAQQFGYSRINGMRTEISGLGEWLGLSSVKKTLQTKDSGGFESVNLHGVSVEKSPLHRRLNLKIVPTWESGKNSSHGYYLKDRVLIETRVARLVDWEEHLEIHSGLRDLVRIATWEPVGYDAIRVLRDSDSTALSPGSDPVDKWCPLKSHVVVGYNSHPLDMSRSLFYFNNLGKSGFGKWMTIREKYGRGINPIMATLESRDWPLETRFMNLMVGLEAIGYICSIEQRISKKSADKERMSRRLSRVYSQIALSLFPQDWHEECASIYNGIKHANKKYPDFDLTLIQYYRAILLFRIWVASRLGVPKSIIRNRLATDSMLVYLRSQNALRPENEW